VAVVKEKCLLVSECLDLVYARRVVRGMSTQPEYLYELAVATAAVVKDAVSVDDLRKRLADLIRALDSDFSEVVTVKFALQPTNRAQVRYILARLTAFVDVECGRSDRIEDYLNQPFEIEHVWANRSERFMSEVQTEPEFHNWRNRLGALLLLPKSSNASFQDLPFGKKVEFYERENQLAASLHPTSRDHNPTLNKMAKRHGLDKLLHGYKTFGTKAIDERQVLYQKLCECVWSPKSFGLSPSRLSQPSQAPRSHVRGTVRGPAMTSTSPI